MYTVDFDKFQKLVIYGGGAVLFEKTRDIRKIGTFDGEKVKTDYFDHLTAFCLSTEPKNARKINLNRTDNFFIKYACEWWPAEKKTALYVHVSEVNVENLGEFVAMEHNGEKDYLYGYKLTFNHGARAAFAHVKRMCVPGSWTIPEEEKKAGAHWSSGLGDYNNSYEVITDAEIERRAEISKKLGRPVEKYNLVHRFITFEDVGTNYYTSEVYHKIEKDDARSEREKIAAALNAAIGSDKFSHYDVDKLLKVVNITLK